MSWRDRIRVHPAADLFPMMSDAELDELGKDIVANGLRVPLVLYCSHGDERRTRPRELQVLDGRNRLAALERAGIRIFDDAGRIDLTLSDLHTWQDPEIIYANNGPSSKEPFDPFAFVVSANIRRRHLTAEQKRDLIATLVQKSPERSDRQIAEIVRASPTTVGVVRAKLERSGEVSRLDTRVGADGVAQPAHKTVAGTVRELPPMPRTVAVIVHPVEVAAPAPSTPAQPLLTPADAAAVRQERPATLMRLSALLKVDTGRTIEELARTLRDAKLEIEALPKEKRIAALRAYQRALLLDDADLRPVG
jgi:DNA-binding Lrp family transcriptional regulator